MIPWLRTGCLDGHNSNANVGTNSGNCDQEAFYEMGEISTFIKLIIYILYFNSPGQIWSPMRRASFINFIFWLNEQWVTL